MNKFAKLSLIPASLSIPFAASAEVAAGVTAAITEAGTDLGTVVGALTVVGAGLLAAIAVYRRFFKV